MKEEFKKEIDAVNVKIDAVNARIDVVNARIDVVNVKIDAMSVTLGQILDIVIFITLIYYNIYNQLRPKE